MPRLTLLCLTVLYLTGCQSMNALFTGKETAQTTPVAENATPVVADADNAPVTNAASPSFFSRMWGRLIPAVAVEETDLPVQLAANPAPPLALPRAPDPMTPPLPDADLPLLLAGDLTQVAIQNQRYADEEKDYGLPPVTSLRIDGHYRGPTTTTIPGGQLVSTHQLHQLLTTPPRGRNALPPLVVNVHKDRGRLIPGAVWMSGAGESDKIGPGIRDRFVSRLDQLTQGNKNRPIVIYSLDNHCWYAYNAAQRAVLGGYRNVMWYRGGIRAWHAANLPYTTGSEDLW